MKHVTSRMLFAYWDHLRGERAAPERGDVRPGGMRHVLADAFVLATGADAATFRLAGSRMCALFGRDLAGALFGKLWHPDDAREVGRLLDLVVQDTAGVVVGAIGANMNGSEVPLEMLLLPLRHGGRTHCRALGALSPWTVPSWAGLVPLVQLHLRSVRIIEPNGEDDAVIGLDGASPRRSPLVVHEGGVA